MAQPISISKFMPQDVYLFGYKDAEKTEKNECPYPGMEEVTVRIVPATWKTDSEHDSMIAKARTMEQPGLYAIQQEIWMCFGGSNMSLLIQKQDENGRLLWADQGDGNFAPLTERLEFPPTMNYTEFLVAIGKLPTPLVEQWWLRTLEVVPLWAERFRPAPPSESD